MKYLNDAWKTLDTQTVTKTWLTTSYDKNGRYDYKTDSVKTNFTVNLTW